MSKRLEIEECGIHWWLREDANVDEVRSLIKSALDAVVKGEVQNVKGPGRHKKIYRLNLAREGEPDYLLKVSPHNPKMSRRPQVSGRRRLSKARHELLVAERSAQNGIATTYPVAAGDLREGRRLKACYTLVPILDDTVDLLELWRSGELTSADKRVLARELGCYIRRMFDAGLYQDDFAANNFLVRRHDYSQIFAIDFERADVRSRISDRARRWMIAKLDRSMARTSMTDRMRFLYHFAGSDSKRAKHWWQVISAFAPSLTRRDLRRMYDSASRGKGRYRLLDANGLKGYSRITVSDEQIEQALVKVEVNDGVCVSQDNETWITSVPKTSSKQLARIWVAANALVLRGLCPSPLGVVSDGSQAFLLFQRSENSALLSETTSSEATQRALRVLLQQLLGYGDLDDALTVQDFVIETNYEGRVRAFLLSAQTFRFVSRKIQNSPRRVTQIVSRLTGDLK